MGPTKVLRKDGTIDDLVLGESGGVLVSFDLASNHIAKKERKAIMFAVAKTGKPVYTTAEPWARDLYVEQNGVVIPAKEFGEMGQGGNYLKGSGFMLISSVIRDQITENQTHPAIKRFFEGCEKIFIAPYGKTITIPTKKIIDGQEQIVEEPAVGNIRHIDITLGSVSTANSLWIDESHYHQEKSVFDYIHNKFGTKIRLTPSINGQPDLSFPNNFLEIRNGERVYAITDENSKMNETSVKKIIPQEEIYRLPRVGLGSIRCITNEGHPELWDALRISYAARGNR